MTRRDFVIKWTLYGLGLLPVWWLELYVLGRFPVAGVTPMLLPLCAVTVAVLEGPVGGAGFGLAVGALCDALYFGSAGAMTLALTLMGWAAGAATTYVLDRNFLGCLLCAAGGLFFVDAGRVFWRAFTGMAALPDLLAVALPEFGLSLAGLVLVYPWLRAVHRRVRNILRL